MNISGLGERPKSGEEGGRGREKERERGRKREKEGGERERGAAHWAYKENSSRPW